MAKPMETVLVTGASSGIGAEIAREVAPLCKELIVVARRKDALETLAHEIRSRHGISVQVLVTDLAVADAAERLWENVLHSATGPVDLLVNNAGFGLYGDCLEIPLAREKEMVALNITALMTLCKLAGSSMVSRSRGYILNLASVASFQPGPGMAVYFATKAFVLSYTESLDCELRGRGVRATALCPGTTDTDFHKVANTERVKWMHQFTRFSAREVAQAGLSGILQGERVVVPGLLNRLMVLSVALLPRNLVTKISQYVLRT